MAGRGGYVSLDDIDDDLFGEPHPNTLSYLRDRVERHASRAMSIFDGFFDDAREVYERYNGESALRRIRSRVRKTADIYNYDVVRPLRTLEEIQRAKPLMQRYLMANILCRIAEENQQIDGYSDDYRNPFVGRKGFDDPDFMRVINGVIFLEDRPGIDTTDHENAWHAHQDLFDHNGERDLDIIEQADILSTWDVMEMHMRAKKKDPTSVLNENM